MFDKTNCTIINKDDKSIVFKGKRSNNVYKLNFFELDKKIVCLLSVNDKKWLWCVPDIGLNSLELKMIHIMCLVTSAHKYSLKRK